MLSLSSLISHRNQNRKEQVEKDAAKEEKLHVEWYFTRGNVMSPDQ